MSGDRLAEIEADARKTLAEEQPSMWALWKPWALDRAEDVLALVEIAKAARDYVEHAYPSLLTGKTDPSHPRLSALGSALARLSRLGAGDSNQNEKEQPDG